MSWLSRKMSWLSRFWTQKITEPVAGWFVDKYPETADTIIESHDAMECAQKLGKKLLEDGAEYLVENYPETAEDIENFTGKTIEAVKNVAEDVAVAGAVAIDVAAAKGFDNKIEALKNGFYPLKDLPKQDEKLFDDNNKPKEDMILIFFPPTRAGHTAVMYKKAGEENAKTDWNPSEQSFIGRINSKAKKLSDDSNNLGLHVDFQNLDVHCYAIETKKLKEYYMEELGKTEQEAEILVRELKDRMNDIQNRNRTYNLMDNNCADAAVQALCLPEEKCGINVPIHPVGEMAVRLGKAIFAGNDDLIPKGKTDAWTLNIGLPQATEGYIQELWEKGYVYHVSEDAVFKWYNGQNEQKDEKSLGNGKGLDDKLLARQQAEAKKSLGNGKGLDDKLQARQQAKERLAKVARAKGKGKND